MFADLEKQLALDYPFMAQNRVESETNTYRRWGCECGSGWYSLIHDLCEAITEKYAAYGKTVDIVVLQVKQKFAGLRFYYAFEGAPCPIPALDSLSDGTGLRLNPDETDDEKTQNLRNEIADIVRTYEERSTTVCERCGCDGQRRKVTPYYILTLCDVCYDGYSKKSE